MKNMEIEFQGGLKLETFGGLKIGDLFVLLGERRNRVFRKVGSTYHDEVNTQEITDVCCPFYNKQDVLVQRVKVKMVVTPI